MMKILQDVHSLLLDDRICSITTPPRIVGGVGIRTGWMDRWVDVRCFISKLNVTHGKADIRHSILVLYKWMASSSTKVYCSELFYIMD